MIIILFPLTLIIISIIKMPNIIHNYKKYLELVAPEEQLREINLLIKEFNKSYLPCPNSNKKYIMINQISMLKKELLINHKLHHHYENNK